jgi:hypothetical protein
MCTRTSLNSVMSTWLCNSHGASKCMLHVNYMYCTVVTGPTALSTGRTGKQLLSVLLCLLRSRIIKKIHFSCLLVQLAVSTT